MKQYYSILFFLLLTAHSYKLLAQQDAQYSQYMYNTVSVNPAYAGSTGSFSVTGLHRSQWVGLEGAPATYTLTLNTPIDTNDKIGVGLSVLHETIGATKETYFDIDFSYSLKVGYETKLNFGLKAGGHLLDLNFDNLSFYSQNDRLKNQDIQQKFSPAIGAGMFLFSEKFYAGLSVPNFLETKIFNKSSLSSDSTVTSSLADERLNVYIMGGYVFDLSDSVKFKPAVLSKIVLGAPLQIDFSANFLLYERLTLGAAYRWSAAVSALAGFQVTDSVFLGFGYDKETTALGNTSFQSGSYEVIVRFQLREKFKRMMTPRFF